MLLVSFFQLLLRTQWTFKKSSLNLSLIKSTNSSKPRIKFFIIRRRLYRIFQIINQAMRRFSLRKYWRLYYTYLYWCWYCKTRPRLLQFSFKSINPRRLWKYRIRRWYRWKRKRRKRHLRKYRIQQLHPLQQTFRFFSLPTRWYFWSRGDRFSYLLNFVLVHAFKLLRTSYRIKIISFARTWTFHRFSNTNFFKKNTRRALISSKRASLDLFKLRSVKRQLFSYYQRMFFRTNIFRRSPYRLYTLKRQRLAWRSGYRRRFRPPVRWLNKTSSYLLIRPRNRFQMTMGKEFIFQRKFTRFIMRLSSIQYKDLFLWFEFNIMSLLMRTTFFSIKSQIRNFLSNNLIFLNFVVIPNENIFVSYWDFIFIFFDYLILELFRYNIRFFYIYRRRLLDFFFLFHRRRRRPFPKYRSYRIPNQIIFYLQFNFSHYFFFELNWFTASFIILKLGFLTSNFTNSHFLHVAPLANSRSLNWKYIS